MKNTLPAVALLLDGARGCYIPKSFVEDFDLTKWQGVDPGDITICQDTDHEQYWDAWQDILDKATFTENGNTWHLYQDGDLWAFCVELMTDEEKSNWDIDD